MKILAIGDVTSPAGARHLRDKLWAFRKEKDIHFCVVNAENASFIHGADSELAEMLLISGADVLTGGNHTMQANGIAKVLEYNEYVLRPINYGDSATGKGYTIVDLGFTRVLVVSAMGNIHMEPVLDSPYSYIDRALCACEGKYDVAILDIHAEATGEKLAIGYNYDGKINVVFGTHTHVPTADGRILPNGTGYISDVGMCGESDGIMGMEPESVIHKLKTRLPGRFKAASGEPVADGVIFTYDDKLGIVTSVERVTF